jgi:IclR family transcriptional regulator, acetate operon repressor
LVNPAEDVPSFAILSAYRNYLHDQEMKLEVFDSPLNPNVEVVDRSGSVKSAQRVLDILEFFASARRPVNLSSIAEALEMPKSSCLALLSTLESNGYLYQLTIGYYPTRKWLDAATVIANNDPLLARIFSLLEQLRDDTGETVILARCAGQQIMYAEVIESRSTVRYSAEVGQFKPIHGTASGKALLATLPVPQRKELISRLDLLPLTPRTIVDAELLMADVLAGIKRGWHMTVGENEPDVTALACTAKVARGVFIVVVAGPIHRLERKLEEAGNLLKEVCRRIEASG